MSFKIYVVASVVNASSYNLFDSPGITRGMIEGVHFSVCVCVCKGGGGRQTKGIWGFI
jgi:hypothetical protein